MSAYGVLVAPVVVVEVQTQARAVAGVAVMLNATTLCLISVLRVRALRMQSARVVRLALRLARVVQEVTPRLPVGEILSQLMAVVVVRVTSPLLAQVVVRVSTVLGQAQQTQMTPQGEMVAAEVLRQTLTLRIFGLVQHRAEEPSLAEAEAEETLLLPPTGMMEGPPFWVVTAAMLAAPVARLLLARPPVVVVVGKAQIPALLVLEQMDVLRFGCGDEEVCDHRCQQQSTQLY